MSPLSTDYLLVSPPLLQETQGVCVAAFGESREFPAFFTRQSGFQAPYHIRNEEEAAELIGVFQKGKAHVGPWKRGTQKSPWMRHFLF